MLIEIWRFHTESYSPSSSSLTLIPLQGEIRESNMQSQLVCCGCRSILVYPRGATNVCCALCNAITAVPPPGMDMSQLVCGGCNILLMYARGAASVRCSCCQTVNIASASCQLANINCGNCHTWLMYPYGAPSVKCAVCHHITDANMDSFSIPIPEHDNGITPPPPASQPQQETVVVENPMTVDESGKLVSSVVVGITTDKK